MTTENYYGCGNVSVNLFTGNVYKLLFIQVNKYMHCLQMSNSQQHFRENGAGTADSRTEVRQEKLGNNFLVFSSRQEDQYCVV